MHGYAVGRFHESTSPLRCRAIRVTPRVVIMHGDSRACLWRQTPLNSRSLFIRALCQAGVETNRRERSPGGSPGDRTIRGPCPTASPKPVERSSSVACVFLRHPLKRLCKGEMAGFSTKRLRAPSLPFSPRFGE